MALQDGSDAGSQGRRGGVDDDNSIYDAETEPSDVEANEADTLPAMPDTLGQQTQRHMTGTLLTAEATGLPGSVPTDQGVYSVSVCERLPDAATLKVEVSDLLKDWQTTLSVSVKNGVTVCGDCFCDNHGCTHAAAMLDEPTQPQEAPDVEFEQATNEEVVPVNVPSVAAARKPTTIARRRQR